MYSDITAIMKVKWDKPTYVLQMLSPHCSTLAKFSRNNVRFVQYHDRNQTLYKQYKKQL